MVDLGREKQIADLLSKLQQAPGTNTSPASPSSSSSSSSSTTTTLEDKVGMTIIPTPGFVIKSTCNFSPSTPPTPESKLPAGFFVPGGKVFINICSHDGVPPVKSATTPDTTTTTTTTTNYNNTAQQQVGLSVPIAVGPVKADVDKEGKVPVVVIDMIVHPSVTIDCERDGSGSFRHWVCNLALQYMERKHGIVVNPQYRLPALKYKGTSVTSQRIRRPPVSATRIQEVKSPSQQQQQQQEDKTSTPFSVLAEAGALPSTTTALGPVQRGGASHAAPSSMRGGAGISSHKSSLHAETIPMNIQVVGKDVPADHEEDFQTKIAKEIGRRGKGGGGGGNDTEGEDTEYKDGIPSLNILKTTGSSSGNSTASSSQSTNNAGGIGLNATVSKRVVKLLDTVVAVAVTSIGEVGDDENTTTTTADDENDDDDDNEDIEDSNYARHLHPKDWKSRVSTKGCTLSPVLHTTSSSTTSTTALHSPLVYKADIPLSSVSTSSSSSISTLHPVSFTLSVTFPEPSNGSSSLHQTSQVPPAPVPDLSAPSAVSVRISGSGEKVTVEANGYRRTVVHLPLSCHVITGGSSSNSSGNITTTINSNSGDQESALLVTAAAPASVVPAHLDPAFRVLRFTLAVRNQTILPPLLPTSRRDMNPDEFVEVLKQYVEANSGAGALSLAPDPGSKPWLLAQAFAEDQQEQQQQEEGEGGASVMNKRRQNLGVEDNIDEQQPVMENDILPEDAFLRSDAVSMHYLRQREDDKKRSKEKDAERAASSSSAGHPAMTEMGAEDYIRQQEEKGGGGSPTTHVSTVGSTSSSSSSSAPAPHPPIDPTILYDLL